MIKFKKVSKIYYPKLGAKKIYALRDINLNIRPGEFVSIVGQSGTGKTTIVKLLLAEEKASSGNIIIGGWDITNIKKYEIPLLRRQIGVVFQDFKLLPKKTVSENIDFALEVCGEPISEIRKVATQIMKIVGLSKKANRYPHQLSGGEQQRVAIARSLVHRPKILIADEPTGNLDSINTQEIMGMLLKINQFGTTIILVTHDREIVNNLRKRVITLDGGMIISDQQQGRYIL